MSFDAASSSVTATTVFGAPAAGDAVSGASGSGLDALQSLFTGLLSAASAGGGNSGVDNSGMAASQVANSASGQTGAPGAAFLTQALSVLQAMTPATGTAGKGSDAVPPSETAPSAGVTPQPKAANVAAQGPATVSAGVISMADTLEPLASDVEALSAGPEAAQPVAPTTVSAAKPRQNKTDSSADVATNADLGAATPSTDMLLAQALLVQVQAPPIQVPLQAQAKAPTNGADGVSENGKLLAPALSDASSRGSPLPESFAPESSVPESSVPVLSASGRSASPVNGGDSLSATANVTETASPATDFAALLAANEAGTVAEGVPAAVQGPAKTSARPASSIGGLQAAASASKTASASATGPLSNNGASAFTLSVDPQDKTAQAYNLLPSVKAVSPGQGKTSNADKETIAAAATDMPVQPDMTKMSDAGLRETAVQAFTGDKAGVATTTTPAVTAPAPGAQMSQASVQTLTDLGLQIQHRLASGQSQFRVQLTPENLGKVDVVLTIGASGDTRAQLTFDSAATAASMAGRMSELRDQLRQSGLQVADDAVSVASVDATAGLSPTGGSAHATETASVVSHAAADTQVVPAASGASSGNLSGNGSQTPGQSMPQTYDQSGGRHHAQSQSNNRGQQPGLADMAGPEAAGPVATTTDSELSLLRNGSASRLALNLIV